MAAGSSQISVVCVKGYKFSECLKIVLVYIKHKQRSIKLSTSAENISL